MPESNNMKPTEASNTLIHALSKFNIDLPKKIYVEIPNDETIDASIQGRFGEWLVCTNKKVHIIKSGFSTGRVGKIGHFEVRYRDIANAFVIFHKLTGYFEITVVGESHSKKTYWGKSEVNPQIAPNSIGINRRDIEKFEAACAYINARSVEDKKAYSESHASHNNDASAAPSEKTEIESSDYSNMQKRSSVRCPKCGSTDLQIYNEVIGKGVSGTKVCLFGLCGFCGAGKTKNIQYWICKRCGYKFKA
jgi:DNA-directed RNA polymerase subunit M/transcription elongation factor TFIIS